MTTVPGKSDETASGPQLHCLQWVVTIPGIIEIHDYILTNDIDMDMNKRRKGLLIVFEGIDGTGKSTQVKLLDSLLRKRGYDVVTTREPTQGAIGKKIRALYNNRGSVSREDELELFLADRREHVERLIGPALADGKIVLCDRYFLSTAAYQGAAGLDPEVILERNRFAPKPDLALLFEIDVVESLSRITDKRGDTLNDFEQRDALKKVAAIFKQMRAPYIERIDAGETVEQIGHRVQDRVMRLIKQDLPKQNA